MTRHALDALVPLEHREEAARFADPVAIINTQFPGVRLPAELWERVRDGKLMMPINDVAEQLRFAPDRMSFTLEGIASLFIPGGAIVMVMDRGTGMAIVMDRTLLKEPQ